MLNTYRDILDAWPFELLEKETLDRMRPRGDLRRGGEAAADHRVQRVRRPHAVRQAADQDARRARHRARRALAAAGRRARPRAHARRLVPGRRQRRHPAGPERRPARPSRPAATRRPGPGSRPHRAVTPGAHRAADQPRAAQPGGTAATAARVRSRRTRCRRTTARRRTGGPRPRRPGQSWPPPGRGSRTAAGLRSSSGRARPHAGRPRARHPTGRVLDRRRTTTGRSASAGPGHAGPEHVGRRRAGAPGVASGRRTGRRAHVPELDRPRAEAAVRELLIAVGEDPDRDGPARDARAGSRGRTREIFAGLYTDPDTVLDKTFDENHHELVLVRDIPMYSTLRAPPAAVPRRRARRLHPGRATAGSPGCPSSPGWSTCYAKRPQVQERLTAQIADALVRKLTRRA